MKKVKDLALKPKINCRQLEEIKSISPTGKYII